MKIKNEKKTYVLIAVLTGLVISLGIAYAALSQTLDITFGNVTQNAQTWKIGFVTQSAAAATTTGGTSATGRTCGTVTTTSTTATITDTTLSKPDDKCIWKLQVKNSGNIGATLSDLKAVQPESTTCTVSGGSMVCGNITYKLTTDEAGSTLYKKGTALAVGATKDLYLVAQFTGSISSTKVTQSAAGFTLVYGQK